MRDRRSAGVGGLELEMSRLNQDTARLQGERERVEGTLRRLKAAWAQQQRVAKQAAAAAEATANEAFGLVPD